MRHWIATHQNVESVRYVAIILPLIRLLACHEEMFVNFYGHFDLWVGIERNSMYYFSVCQQGIGKNLN